MYQQVNANVKQKANHRNGMNVGRWLSFFGLIAILMSLLKSSVRAIATRIAQYACPA
jgi:hypothetical protein